MIAVALALLGAPLPACGDLEDGIALYEAGKRSAALAPLARAAAADPKDLRPLLYAGLCLQDLHRLEEAAQTLEKARALDPSDARVANALSRVLLEADRLEEAGTLLAQALLRHPEDPDLLFASGLASVRSGRPADARGPLERMLARAPSHRDAPRAHAMLGQICARAGEPEKAREHRRLSEKKDLWLRALETRKAQVRENPRDPLAWLGLGLAWMEAGEGGQAEAAFAKSVEVDPGFARGRFHEGEARRARGDLRAAAESYREAVRLDPRYTRAHYHLGLAAANLGNGPEAKSAFERVLALDPEAREDAIFKECWKHLGRLAEAAGDRDRARDCYREYLRRGGRDPEVPARLRALGG
ncbi:MAG: tetratricopeptide repeat protein [Planctomycetes bacterium]|nr:tetratricopeptide repeat protein [Planctomycetota bacterium]